MNQNLLRQVFAGLTVASLTLTASTTIVVQPSYAAKANFYCGTTRYGGRRVPATYARTQNGRRVLIIRWVSNYFSKEWTPLRRCNLVSRNFQRLYDQGQLKYIKSGWMRGLPVLCAVTSPRYGCRKNNVLFTLKPGSNPQYSARKLLNRRGLASGVVLNESGSNSLDIDFEIFLKNSSEDTNTNSVYYDKEPRFR
ncbi:MAG: COP23 domain-containing protein [Cyanobacteria bacterium P01_A01_bin.84]